MNEQFKTLAQQICNLFLDEGVLIRPFSNPRLSFFATLPKETQKVVLNDMNSYRKLCETMKLRGQSLQSTRELTEQALLQLGLQANPDHLDVIENHHLVEIYNLNHTQIFRSFKYFEVSSYTLEDIYCRKWWNLYERSAEDESTIQKIVSEFLGTSEKTIQRVQMPEHIIREKETLERLVIKTQILWLIPLYRGSEFAAIMAVETSHL
ncbi:hypothetical protein [Bdellovibrio svalbardensis]|uniref:Uncharacterized protein n=1 Tax=Bdellovibrio svalbardensis TaxID=2972972 RepID=A0ABT6DMK1_9BACT|nr:hypothetical protein [Bdellovibrio svalbardensis]MDG0818093.1 hypothetical protein [Bdellovibrio svalbardensis]